MESEKKKKKRKRSECLEDDSCLRKQKKYKKHKHKKAKRRKSDRSNVNEKDTLKDSHCLGNMDTSTSGQTRETKKARSVPLAEVDGAFLASLKPRHSENLKDPTDGSTDSSVNEPTGPVAELNAIFAKHGVNGQHRQIIKEVKSKGLFEHMATGIWKKAEIEQLKLNWDIYKLSHPDIENPERIFTMTRREKKVIAKETCLYETLAYKIKRPYDSVRNKAKLELVDWKKGRLSSDEWDTLNSMKSKGMNLRAMSEETHRPAMTISGLFRTRVTDKYSQGQWTQKEDKKLIYLVENTPKHYNDLRNTYSIQWTAIANEFKRRNINQCIARYTRVLKWKRLTGAEHRPQFTSQDKISLLEDVVNENVQCDADVDWLKLSKKYYNVLYPSLLKTHWLNLRSLVPQYKIKTLDQITDYLLEHEMPRLQARVDRKLKRLSEREDKKSADNAEPDSDSSSSSDTE